MHCHSSLLYNLFGKSSIEDLITQRTPSFITAMANLPLDSLPRQILAPRESSLGLVPNKSSGGTMSCSLNSTSPSYQSSSTLLTKPRHWRLERILPCGLMYGVLEAHKTSFLGSCELQLLKPTPQWKVTVGDLVLARLNKFRIRLLVHGLRWAGA